MNLRTLPALAFLACIVAANVVTSHYGLIPVGFGLRATAGTYLAGATFVLRDLVDDLAGRRAVLALIVAGAVLSLALADPAIALASAAAFLLSELADWTVYRPLRRRGYVRAALASNLVGAVVDSVVFLSLAGDVLHVTLGTAMPGQLVGKLTITAAVLVLVGVARRARTARAAA